jgi:hypothetical protein
MLSNYLEFKPRDVTFLADSDSFWDTCARGIRNQEVRPTLLEGKVLIIL